MSRLDYLSLASFFLTIPMGLYSYYALRSEDNFPISRPEAMGAILGQAALALVIGVFAALLSASITKSFRRSILPAWAISMGVITFVTYYKAFY
ncbi:hypothetical protein A7A09_013900 [Paracoccus methylarcula]|uniref:Uncharacterized protein n=1 Tax=Paracoccus methylarcula TaxID=72022 RepID=A0A422QVJ1_9RHOB|nr:hypothetical protein A7A09_013900 [Paracoccus methylarcula]